MYHVFLWVFAHFFGSQFDLFSSRSVPDSPHEPDPEPYEPMPARLIPLDEVSTAPTLSFRFTSDHP